MRSLDVSRSYKGRYKTITTLLISAVLFSFAIASAQAQSPACSCTFKEAPWEAYGTKAACTTITRKGGTSCEIEFGGLSADPRIASALGIDADDPSKVYQVLETFLRLLRNNDRATLSQPRFLSEALPIFMRGAYLRPPHGDLNAGQVRSLDRAVKMFADKYSDQVSKVFLGSTSEFSTTIDEASFTVGPGYVVVRHPFAVLVTRYLPQE
ncbi:hypothetical protein XI03_11215 [Bradyrhizobium sp. CCBAU 65884]|nr:hypothetical protein [Bradyrhizobium sp. CCBAU 65884]